MKKLIIILIVLSFVGVCLAASIQDKHKAVIARRNVAAPAGAKDYAGTDANCQGAWLFNDNLTDACVSGSAGANDLTDGGTIVYSTTRPTQYSTPQGKSADFEAGDSDYLYRANAGVSANFPGKSDAANFSVSFWLKYENLSCNYGIIGKNFNTGWGVANLWVTDRCSMRIKVFDGTDGAYGTLDLDDDTDWHHFVVIFHGASNHIHFYMSSDGGTFGDEAKHDDVDGTPIVLTDVDFADANTGDLELGMYSATNFLDGLLYQMIVFNDVLTASEAEEIYNNGITGNDG